MSRKHVTLIGVVAISVLIGSAILYNITHAQVPGRILMNLYAYTDKEEYPRGKTVTLFITNLGPKEVIISYYAVMRVSPPAGNVTYEIIPPDGYLTQYDSLTLTWDQLDTFGNQVLAGKYIFVIVYWLVGTDMGDYAYSSDFDIRGPR